MTEIEPLARFHWVVENHHQYAKEWQQRTGRPVVGYFCTYVPEEIIYATGALPVRIRGAHEPQDITEPHIFGMFCPYSRDCLAQGLLGRYDYLDGIVSAHGCYHIRQTFDSWKRHLSTPFKYYIFMPTRVQVPSARRWLPQELSHFKQALEGWTGQAISDEALFQAIEVYNTNRRLLKQVYELRKGSPPAISGSEAMEMVLSSMLMDKKEHNELLTRLLAQLPQRERKAAGVRFILIGSEVDDSKLLKLIESLGGEVVVDDNCVGSRYFWNEVVKDSDPIHDIARRYLDKPPCPIYDVVERRRLAFISQLLQDYRVESAVLVQLKFCDPHEYDMPAIQNLLKEKGIPALLLECDITVPEGQFRTRLEAHLEMSHLAGV